MLAVHALQLPPAFAARRERQDHRFSALEAVWSFGLSHQRSMGTPTGIVGTVPDSELKLIRLCQGVSGRSPTQER